MLSKGKTIPLYGSFIYLDQNGPEVRCPKDRHKMSPVNRLFFLEPVTGHLPALLTLPTVELIDSFHPIVHMQLLINMIYMLANGLLADKETGCYFLV